MGSGCGGEGTAKDSGNVRGWKEEVMDGRYWMEMWLDGNVVGWKCGWIEMWYGRNILMDRNVLMDRMS